MFDVHRISGAAYAVKVDGDDFYFAAANQACLSMTAMAVGFHPGLTPHDIFPDQVADDVLRRYRTCVSTRDSISYASEAAAPSGLRMWRTTLFPLVDKNGRVTTIIGVLTTLTEGNAKDTLSLNAKASLAIDALDGGYWIYEVNDSSFETSPSLAELLAGPGHATLSLAEYISHVHSEDLAAAKILDTQQDRSVVEYRVVGFGGRKMWLRSRRRTVRDANGAPIRVIGVVTDVTREKSAFDALQTEASTDALTSIKNRRAFDRLALEAFRKSRTDNQPVGILLIDLDDFKPINDRYGHRGGDEILRKAARRISRFVRKSDCFARLGGDEFAILLRERSAAEAEPLATRLRQAFAKPVLLGRDPVFVGISTGVGISSAHDQKIADVIDRADSALYAMKEARRLKTA